jgi:hypothetical protein
MIQDTSVRRDFSKFAWTPPSFGWFMLSTGVLALGTVLISWRILGGSALVFPGVALIATQ